MATSARSTSSRGRLRRPGGGLLLLARGRGWSESTCGRLSKVAPGSTFIGVDLRSTQRGRPRVGFNRSRPAVESARGRPRVGVDRSRPVVDSARSPQGRLLSESTCGRLSEVAPGSALIGVDLRSSQRGVALGSTLIGVDLHHTVHTTVSSVGVRPSVHQRSAVCPARP